jgi:hypothetical protein
MCRNVKMTTLQKAKHLIRSRKNSAYPVPPSNARAQLEEALNGITAGVIGIPTDSPLSLVFEIDSNDTGMEYLVAAIQVLKGSTFDINV